MCYSIEDSQNAFIIGIISSIILFTGVGIPRGGKEVDYKITSLFLMFITFMQLYDYYFWKYPSSEEKNLDCNRFVTKLAIISNHLQPIILLLLGLYYKGFDITVKGNFALIILYAILMIPYTKKAFEETRTTDITKCEECPTKEVLTWSWNYLENGKLVYFVYLLLTVALLNKVIEDTRLKKILIGFTIASFIFSIQKYNIIKNVGRMWCYISSFLPLFILLTN